MTWQACAELVRKGDPDRFLAAMAAPVAARPVLFALYAFNVEVSRAPWVTAEPMIAEMRLQWWRDALEEIAAGKPPRAHEVAGPLADVLDAEGAQALDRLVAARRWDIGHAPFEDAAHFESYLDATAAGLMWTSVRLLGGAERAVQQAEAARQDPTDPNLAEGVVRALGRAAGLARFLAAVPELEARGRVPLVDGRPQAVAALARRALADAGGWAATAALALRPRPGPGLLEGWMAAPNPDARRFRDPGRGGRTCTPWGSARFRK